MSRVTSIVCWAGALSALLILTSLQAAVWQYDREAILHGGQVWRLFSAALPHLTWPHAALNGGLGFVLLSLLAREMDWRRLLVLTLLLDVLTHLALLLFTSVAQTQGLSGVLHGLTVWVLFLQWRSPSHPLYRALVIAIGLALAAKLYAEQAWVTPSVWSPAWGFVVTRASHLCGAVAGLVLVQWLRRK